MELVIILINIVVVRIVYTNYPRFSFATTDCDWALLEGEGGEKSALQHQTQQTVSIISIYRDEYICIRS